MNNDPAFVLASTWPPEIYDFFDTLEAAQDRAKAANASTSNARYEPMSTETFREAERTYYLSQPLTPISKAAYDVMFHSLIPVAWWRDRRLESFCSAEPIQGRYHQQYACFAGRYATRIVDVHDRSTRITREELMSILPSRADQIEQQRQEPQGRAL